MKKANYLSLGTLVLALALVLGIGVLTGCSQGASDDASTEKQEATADAGNEKADDAEADTEKTADDGPVWVITRNASVYTDKDSGTKTTSAIVYELDEHGNAVKSHLESDNSADASAFAVTAAFDENGYLKSSTEANGKEITYTPEVDENGRLTKLVGSDGTTQAFTYNEDGNIEIGSVSGQIHGEDTEGNIVEKGAYTSTNTYDADGFVTEYRFEGETITTITYAYERDENDKIVACTATQKANDADEVETRYTVEFDENGNIARTLEDGEGYSIEKAYEYALVESPSAWVRANAHIKPF